MAQNNLRVIVVGGGAAGISAASTARTVNPEASVILFTEYEDVAYSPCGIPFVHGREIPDFKGLFLQTSEHYAEIGIDLRFRTTVTGINLNKRTVNVDSQVFEWDRLIIATGFEYEKPNIPGIDLEGLHYVKNIRRAMEFDKILDQIKKVVVASATPLGIEMAGNLAHRGLETHIMEPVQKSLEELGAKKHFGTKVLEFTGSNGKVKAVSTTNGEIDCDVVIVATHKKPNNRLSREAGIKIGSTGGILVDDHMRTSVKDVYAAGDCVEVI